MFNQASKKSLSLARQCLVPMLLLGAAAQASAAEVVNATNVTFALCRNDTAASQYAKNKDGTWNTLNSAGAAAKLTQEPRPDEWSITLLFTNGKKVQIDLWQNKCLITSPTGQDKFYIVETSAAL
ncbi:hypothetical protein [Ideonella sp.]|uniref:hypothetical protein n=1 Tax=Ideonella sp. TaxID=1929293 RepID=UPI003BB63486